MGRGGGLPALSTKQKRWEETRLAEVKQENFEGQKMKPRHRCSRDLAVFSLPSLKALRDHQTLSQPFLTRQVTLRQCPRPPAWPGLSASLERLIPEISDLRSGAATSWGPAPHSSHQQV